jgi:hypothetical protein
MSEVKYGLETLKKIKADALGNYTVLFVGPWNNQQIQSVAQFCRDNKLKFVMDEMINRHTGELKDKYCSINKVEINNIIDIHHESFDGSLIMCEYGGLMLYWPQNYVKGSNIPLSVTSDFAVAEAEMITRLKSILEYAGLAKIPTPFICIEASGGVAKYLYKAGIDRVDLEVTYNPYNEFFYSAVKGATAAFNKGSFGVDMAMVWYGGNQHDELWFHRWKNSLLHAFIRGANPIYAEHGLMDYKALGKNLGSDQPEVKRFRKAVGDLAELTERHPRPASFPKAKIAVIHGNLDSFAALGQTHLWGQRHNDDMKNGTAEDSWELFNTFYQRLPWEFRYKYGDHDYSGNPPFGQIDVIPTESSVEFMQQYECLIFLGWNSMTTELYDKLTGYVKAGGHLLSTVAHLNCATGRGQPMSIINNGDIRELFGVMVNVDSPGKLSLGIKFKQNPASGNYQFPLWSPNCDPKYCDGSFPMAGMKLDSAEVLAVGSEKFIDNTWNNNEVILTGNQFGRGMAFLVNSLEYPGHPGLKNFYRDLLRFFCAAWHRELLVECSDRVRYSVYQENDNYILYLLNTEENISQNALVNFGGNHNIPVRLSAGEVKAVYCSESLMAIPDNILDRIVNIEMADRKIIYKTLRDKSGRIVFYIDSAEFDGACIVKT